jgi:hypothetical protein
MGSGEHVNQVISGAGRREPGKQEKNLKKR